MAPELVQLVILYLMAVNLAAFFLMGVDKRRAVGKKWRISEKTLFLPAVLGGALGGHSLCCWWSSFCWWSWPCGRRPNKERRGHPWVSPPLCSISDYSFFS